MDHSPISTPSGTVVFLFTDIEGSTKRWEQYGETMHAAHARQETILRDAIASSGGYAYKMIGDAFQVAFATAPQALAAVLAAQRALHTEEWGEVGPIKVRMALHAGITEERGTDYVGPLLNRVARLLSTGYGGQTLLTQAAYDLLVDNLPEGVTLLDLGEHQLKDLTRPEHVYQVVASDLPSEFPHIKSLDYRPNNLPVQPTPLIGRENELAAIEKMLLREDMRLVTLTGPGGTGKTRLGLQAAADLLDEFADGVFIVNLAPISDPNLVGATVAQTLDIRETAGRPLVDTLKEYLRDRQILLVLDNFEQVIEAAPIVSELLSNAARLKLLVTSRVKLQLRGEHEYSVPPLSLPDPTHMPSLEQLTQYEAVRLFIERAQAAKADFEVTNDNGPAVAEICVRLDGLPLAIELAAARIKILPPQTMLSRLQSRLKLLTGGSRDLPARQQTLRGAIEWSYDLLTEGEQQLFRRLAVFVGGRTLEAMEAVSNANGDLQMDVLDGVQSLVDKSLLRQAEGVDDEPRFVMLETIHEFAWEKLEESGEAAALRAEHAAYFLRLVEELEDQLDGPQQVRLLDLLEAELDNLRAALHHFRESGETGKAIRLVWSIRRFMRSRGNWSEGHEWAESLLSRLEEVEDSGESPGAESGSQPETTRPDDKSQSTEALRAKALFVAGNFAHFTDHYETARRYYEQSLQLHQQLGDKAAIVGTLLGLADMHRAQGETGRAEELNQQALELSREAGDKRGMVAALGGLASQALRTGDYIKPQALLEERLALLRQLGNKTGIIYTLRLLGELALVRGDYNAARSLMSETLEIAREVKDKALLADTFITIGELERLQGNYAEARSNYQQSLDAASTLADKSTRATALANLGYVEHFEGDDERAREHLTEAISIYHNAGSKVLPPIIMAAGLVGVIAAQGEPEKAARLLGAADAWLGAIGIVLEPADRVGYDRDVAALRAQLDEATFQEAYAEGRAMSEEQAIAHALGKSTGNRHF